MIKQIINGLFIGFFLVLGAVVVLSFLGQISLYVVRSGSMEPTIPVNSLLIVKPSTASIYSPVPGETPKYGRGDIITFKSTSTPVPVTHRIFSVEKNEGGVFYQTKGDANQSPDSKTVSQKNVLGGVVITVPYVGYSLDFASSVPGFLLIIVVPASFVILKEMIAIQEEFKKARLKSAFASGLVVLIIISLVPTVALFNDDAVLESNFLSTKESFSEFEVPPECAHIEFDSEPIIGTETGDKLVGTNGNDLIFGLGGGDKIDGGNGDDCLVGGDEGDSLNGGNGEDVLLGGDDSDKLEGGNGKDTLIGGGGSDSLNGNNGDDQLSGGEGSDGLKGENGDDYLDGGPGSDGLDGGPGTDTCINGEGLQYCELP